MGMLGFFALLAVGFFVAGLFTKGDKSSDNTSEGKMFYLNKTEAMKDGKLHNMTGDDDGPGFYH